MRRVPKVFLCFVLYLLGVGSIALRGYVVANFSLSLIEFLEISTRKDDLTPIVDSKKVIMFYPPDKSIRKVFAVFDFDGYTKKYLFQRNKHGLFFVKVGLPHGLARIKYKLVVDGIWTNDEYNANVVYDKDFIPFSVIDISGTNDSYVSLRNPIDSSDSREVEIFYIGRPGQVVTIAGNFNNFNPFLNRLVEKKRNKGVYTIKLKDLPKGRIYYYFVDSGNKVIDKNNVNRTSLYFVKGKDDKIDFEVSYFDN